MSVPWSSSRQERITRVFRNNLNHRVLKEIATSGAGGTLSANTRSNLEQCSLAIRREIVNSKSQDNCLLFRACQKGQVKIVEYLIEVCGADIEQKDTFSIQQDIKSNHIVTPLWCAAVTGNLKIVELLLKAGADINAASDSGSTPLRSACFMTHINVVKFLVEHGADINQTNFNGGTCLINSVQSPELCSFLLENGADINARDIQDKTALHYAIQEHRLDTTKILLDFGADYTAKTRYGDDALQMACLTAASPIFDFLTTNVSYKPERIANAYELIGASYFDVKNDVTVCLNYWRIALTIRNAKGLHLKVPFMPTLDAYRHQKEFETVDELSALEGNMENIRTQSLLIAERILGTHHKDTIHRVMFRGAAYADMRRYQRCIDLWCRALKLRIERDTILSSDSQFTAKALVMLMDDYNKKSVQEGLDNMEKRRRDVVTTFQLISQQIVWATPLLQLRPQVVEHLHIYEKTLRYLIRLIDLMIETKTNQHEIRKIVTILVKENITCFLTGNSLLHFVVTSLPNAINRGLVAKILLQCGSNVNVMNHHGSTPLHIATKIQYYSSKLINVLIDFGAHLDQPDSNGFTALNSLKIMNHQHLFLSNCSSLKCLCATQIARYEIPYEGQLPYTLEQFMELHEPPQPFEGK